MNEQTSPEGPPEASSDRTGDKPGDRTDAPSGSAGFFAWLRGLGIVRRSDRWFAGVAGGIAAKAGIDPLIVRGIFVVLAILGGPGILLYLVGWLMLPDVSGRIHLEDVFRGRATAGVIVTLVILGALIVIPAVLGLPGLFAGVWIWDAWDVVPDWVRITFTVIWWGLVLPGLVIWLIVWASRVGLRSNASVPEQRATDAPEAPRQKAEATQSNSEEPWAQRAERRATEWGEEFGRKAENWGHRMEEKSKEWERRGAEYSKPHALGAAHVVITLACALLAAGWAAGWAYFQFGDSNAMLTAGLVAAVAVLGVSMIVAGIRGRHTGWVGFLAFVGVIALIFAPFTTILPTNTQFIPFGNVDDRIDSGTSDSALVMVGGNPTLDLSALDRDDAPRSVDLWLGGGNVTVKLPETHPVRVRINLMGGNVTDRTGTHASAEENARRGILISHVIESRGALLDNADNTDATQVRVRLMGGNVTVEGGNPEEIADLEQLQREIRELEERIRLNEADREQLEDRQRELENAR